MRRGFTLIELMVAVAVLAIGGLLAGQLSLALRTEAVEAELWERAQQCLEYEASALLEGREAEAEVRRALLAELPQGKLAQRREGEVVVLEVSYRAPRGAWRQRELYLVRRAK